MDKITKMIARPPECLTTAIEERAECVVSAATKQCV